MEYECKKYCAEDRIAIKGQEVQYQITSEEFPFFDKTGALELTMHTMSYVRTDADEDGRPVLFAYNGGPGAGATLVNLGALAPERVDMGDAVSMNFTPPFNMEPNPDTVLDICDIVVIDPVASGFSKVFQDTAKKYFNSQGDASMIVQTMYQWLTAHERWNCPILVMGESYGTIRNALVAEQIYLDVNGDHCNALNIHLNGIIMLGTALDHGQAGFPIERAVINFTSIAASYWYHHQTGKPELEAFLEEAEEFAYRQYLPALALGSSLQEEEKEEIIEKLEYFTGLSRDWILKKGLRIETRDYPIIGMQKEKKLMSRYDGRFLSEEIEMTDDYDMFGDDPCCSRIMPAFTHCFNGFLRKKLGMNTTDYYDGLNMYAAANWDFKTDHAPYISLKNAMRKNPGLKVMFGTGYYDMVTTPGYAKYLVNYANLPKDRIKMEFYRSGHMPYLGSEPAEKLGRDLHDFIRWACPSDKCEE